MKCFRWRVARECGKDNFEVKCNPKHRAALDTILESMHQGQSVTFTSPGFHRQNTSEPKGAYFNRNFCIFNISLAYHFAHTPPRLILTSSSVGDKSWTELNTNSCHHQVSMEYCGQMTTRTREEDLKLKLDAKHVKKLMLVQETYHFNK